MTSEASDKFKLGQIEGFAIENMREEGTEQKLITCVVLTPVSFNLCSYKAKTIWFYFVIVLKTKTLNTHCPPNTHAGVITMRRVYRSHSWKTKIHHKLTEQSTSNPQHLLTIMSMLHVAKRLFAITMIYMLS